jgi:dGTP triphosphohydrolase
MVNQRAWNWNEHPHLAWAMWGLDEIEATLASIESRLHSRTSVSSGAESALVDMRIVRDAFRSSIEEQVNQASFAPSKADLEGQWAAFEDSVQNYLETVDKQVREQETVFRARADAQSKAWLQAIDSLHQSAPRLAAEPRSDVETAVKHLESEADAAKVRLDKLNKAEDASWAAMRSALAETRTALDHAHHSVLDALGAKDLRQVLTTRSAGSEPVHSAGHKM